MPETIEAKELQLMNIFSDAYLFDIPEYQRPYAWTTDQVNDLLDDLTYAMERSDSLDAMPPYFLGSIVIIKDSNSTLCYIVDGQQRITTLTILFCVLRELSTNNSAVIDVRIRENSDPFTGTVGRFRLNVRERDRHFFQSNIQEVNALPGFLSQSVANQSDSQQRMSENAEHIWKALSNIDEERRNRLMSFLLQRCYLVVVSASGQFSAYRIFSVMNDRGLDLSPTDILKAEIIGALNNSERNQYTEIWEDIEDELDREHFRDLFTHIRMIYMKDKARRALNQEFNDGVMDQIQDNNFIDDILTPYADVYETVSRANYEGADGAENVNAYLEHLRRLDNADWIPPVMEFFNRNQHDADLLLRFIQDMDRLAYGMFIRRSNINQRISRYADILRAIERDDDLFEHTSPLQLIDDEKSEILQVLEGSIYSMLRVRKPLLLRLDSMLASVGATYSHSIITVEHVLPQKPGESSGWFDSFPNEEEREQWTHRLANLVLLSRYKNSRAQNYEFHHKKKEYFQKNDVTPFALTLQVVNEHEWTPAVLERRQEELIRTLKREWRLD